MKPTLRMSENVLFVLLMAAVVGWIAAPIAVDFQPAAQDQAGRCIA